MRTNVKRLAEQKKKSTNWNLVREYILLLWDGLGFFGFDETKLERLRGAKVDYFTKFKSAKWMITNILLGTFVLLVLRSAIMKIGTMKSQTVVLERKDTLLYPAKEALTIMVFNYLKVT